MSMLMIAVAICAAPVDARADRKADREAGQPRKFHQISADVRDAMRAESRAKTKLQRAAVIHRLTDLYLELKRDPRLATSDTLKSYKAKLWSRLTRIKRDLVREFGLPRSKARAPARLSRGRRLRFPSAATSPIPTPKADATQALAAEIAGSLSDQLDLVGGALGGPGQLLGQAAARGGNAKFDYGPELVDLIERVITPDFWDTNGGPGSIFYFRPLHALVVSATAEVHHQLGGVLDGVRRVSR